MSYEPPTTKNIARCLKCGDVVISKHVHDFRSCKCGEIFVDGGNDYWRHPVSPYFERIIEAFDAPPETWAKPQRFVRE